MVRGQVTYNLHSLYLLVTSFLAAEDRVFVDEVIRHDLPASAVNSEDEEFITANCCEDHCCEGHCSCDQSDDDDDGGDDNNNGGDHSPDVFVSSGVWDV